MTTEEIWLKVCVADSLEKMVKSLSWSRPEVVPVAHQQLARSSCARCSVSVFQACMLMLSERFFP